VGFFFTPSVGDVRSSGNSGDWCIRRKSWGWVLEGSWERGWERGLVVDGYEGEHWSKDEVWGLVGGPR
jgi:hypothetical protein